MVISKHIRFFLVLAVVATATLLFSLSKTPSATTSLPQLQANLQSTPSDSAHSQAAQITETTENEKTADTKIITNSSLPSWKDLQANYLLPENNIPEYVAELLKIFEQDRDGITSMKLYKAFAYCLNAPKDNIELEERKKFIADFMQLDGRNNGEIQASFQYTEKQYTDCTEINQLTTQTEPYDYILNAARLGDPLAKVGLAIGATPPDLSQWPEEAKSSYRKEIGKYLEEARAQCEPRAFQAYAHAQTLEEGVLWDDPNPIQNDIRSYANLLAYGLFYENKTADGQAIVQQNNNALQMKIESMSPEDVATAKAYGRNLFDTYCN